MIPEIAEIVRFRHTLHQHPELSGNEYKTGKLLDAFLATFQPDSVIRNLGGTGLAFIFDSRKPGPTVLFRSDMDALPIHEINDFSYASQEQGVAHKCGHDGHMAIMTAFASLIHKNRPTKGRVVLLFQPAEETGEGAFRVVTDPQFQKIQPDFVFGLHNLPGFPLHQVVMASKMFASASKGMIIKLTGKTSHAAEPENGINPAMAVSGILSDLLHLTAENTFQDFALVTVIHARIGERAFGTSAGYAEVMATLRTFRNDDMEHLTRQAEQIAQKHARSEKLQLKIDYTENFPALENHPEANALLMNSVNHYQLSYKKIDKPFRWSEDFSHFTLRYKGCMFGLGAGLDTPKLHNPDYDFPDAIIETGAALFFNIYQQLNAKP
jgi:amidohydrolase